MRNTNLKDIKLSSFPGGRWGGGLREDGDMKQLRKLTVKM